MRLDVLAGVLFVTAKYAYFVLVLAHGSVGMSRSKYCFLLAVNRAGGVGFEVTPDGPKEKQQYGLKGPALPAEVRAVLT